MSKTGPAESDERLISAYQQVFKVKTGNDNNVFLVLKDLADLSGYYEVIPEENATALNYARDAGRREVFARILFLLGVPEAYREALRSAVLAEREALNGEG